MTKKVIRIVAVLALAGIALFAFGITAFASGPVGGVKPLPKGTKAYFTYSNGYNFVVSTSGVNASLTKSFEIDAPPYGDGTPGSGVVWNPYINNVTHQVEGNAFSNYLNQIGEFVYGPGNAWIPPNYPHVPAPTTTKDLTLFWKGKTVYTNNVETYVYQGTGNNSGEAELVTKLLTTGSIFP